MPLVYYDKAVLKKNRDTHPSIVVDEQHPCYRMVREAIDGKSVFHWSKEQAIQMYIWYLGDGWRSIKIETEFNESIYESDFKEIIASSHYLVPDPKKKNNLIPSPDSIYTVWAAYEMEKKLLEANGAEVEDED